MHEGFHERRRRGGVSIVAIVFPLVLLICPILAMLRLSRKFDPRFVFGYAILISVVTYLFYRHDKKRAQSGGWRTSESNLHFVELIGGWPGAFLAQSIVHHKNSKLSYQVIFWMIVALHEFASFDFIQDWHYTRTALLFFQQ